MILVNNFSGIEFQERQFTHNHIIILLLVKPSDDSSHAIIKNFNYYHHKAGDYCNIYPIGYANDFPADYHDVQEVNGVNNSLWKYSDKCFIEFLAAITDRLPSWRYCEDIQVVVLQSDVDGTVSKLDFSNYYSLDIEYGIKKGYIESFPKFFGHLLDACKQEIKSGKAIQRARIVSISKRKLLEIAIGLLPKTPLIAKKILQDRTFYMPSNNPKKKVR